MKSIYTILFLLTLTLSTHLADAQPSPAQLADQMAERNNDNLEQIETLSMTVETFGMSSTTHMVKSMDEDIATLQIQESAENSPNMMSTSFDQDFYRMIRAASSITSETVGDYDVWRVLIDDPEVLNESMMDGFEMNNSVQETRQLVLWIDSDELIPRQMRFESVTNDGEENSGEMTFLDYQTHSGLPIAHLIEFRIDGMENMMSEEEMQQAQEQMAQFESQMEQMDNMPESMRSMIEERLRPQMEVMQQMMNGSSNEAITIRVLDVQINP